MKAIILSLLMIQSAFPCTIFSLYPNEEHWVGRTFDWAYGHGLVYINKRNVTKTSVRILPTDVLSTWTSKYGSVTFNQFGREFPTGGMNERGLIVEALELKSSVYQPVDTKASFNELQFIQFVLDNFQTISEMRGALKDLRLAPVGSQLHYFTCDIKECMTIEFINGKIETRQGNTLPISGLANNTYDESKNYAKDFVTFGGEKPVVQGSKESLDRFVRSNYNAKSINEYDNKIQTLFAFLADVGSVNNRWQIIYNQTQRTINFRTTAKIKLQRMIDVSALDFSCQTPVQYYDLDSDSEGPIRHEFKDFDFNVNQSVIKKSVDMQKLPVALTMRLAVYPNETKCND
nr:linear amide C-N hydrolase [Bacteriovorax sp. HI3]